jgi:hypothetical protein
VVKPQYLVVGRPYLVLRRRGQKVQGRKEGMWRGPCSSHIGPAVGFDRHCNLRQRRPRSHRQQQSYVCHSAIADRCCWILAGL